MVGSTDCAFWQRMGLDYIGSQYKEGDLSESDVYNILKSCYQMEDRAIADFILRYSDQEDVPVGPTPPEELPPEDPTDCRLWSGAGRPYTDVILEANAGMLNSGQVNQILTNCYEMDDDEIERIITELFYAPEDDEQESQDDQNDIVIEKDMDPLLVILGAIVLGMVFYFVANTTKEAL